MSKVNTKRLANGIAWTQCGRAARFLSADEIKQTLSMSRAEAVAFGSAECARESAAHPGTEIRLIIGVGQSRRWQNGVRIA